MPTQVPGDTNQRISVDEASKMYDSSDTVFIDVRREDEYINGHIKDALLIPVDDILSRIGELPEDKKLIFICAAGVRSGLACEMSAAMGINSSLLYSITEGTDTWIEKGNPTSYGSEK